MAMLTCLYQVIENAQIGYYAQGGILGRLNHLHYVLIFIYHQKTWLRTGLYTNLIDDSQNRLSRSLNSELQVINLLEKISMGLRARVSIVLVGSSFDLVHQAEDIRAVGRGHIGHNAEEAC